MGAPQFNPLGLKEILSADDRPITPHYVDAWGGHIFLRVMSGKERDAFDAQQMDKRTDRLVNYRARLLSLVVCDQDGERLFTDPEDIAKLGDKSAAVLDEIFDRALTLNRLTGDGFDDLVKNSNGDQSAVSGSS